MLSVSSEQEDLKKWGEESDMMVVGWEWDTLLNNGPKTTQPNPIVSVHGIQTDKNTSIIVWLDTSNVKAGCDINQLLFTARDINPFLEIQKKV